MSMGTLEHGDFDLWRGESESLGQRWAIGPKVWGAPPAQVCTPVRAALHSPRNVVEMYSETWFPDLLISDRCVSSRFSILLN